MRELALTNLERSLLLAMAGVALVVSGIAPYDRPTWWLEVAPVLLAAPLLVATHRRFPLTRLVYWLIFLHALLLIVGGHYTYARVPLGEWARELFGLGRNHYDRLGHFAQGFVPAIVAREVLLRLGVVKRGGWLLVLVTAICLAISALYELVEWGTALLFGQGAEAFLGTQGDPWDTQCDLFLALIGALVAQLTLGRVHDTAIARVAAAGPDTPPDASIANHR